MQLLLIGPAIPSLPDETSRRPSLPTDVFPAQAAIHPQIAPQPHGDPDSLGREPDIHDGIPDQTPG
jgi:hypothetical protein